MGKSKDLATLKSGLSIDGTLTTTSTGTNLTSNSYNVVKIQTDKDDNGSNDDAILQFTTGSSNTVKGELRYDESESKFEIGHGDNQGHIAIDSSGRVTKPSQPAWRIGRGSTVTVTNGHNTHSAINFNLTSDTTRRFFTQGGITISSGVVTVPVAGVYNVGYAVRFDGVGSGYGVTTIGINGSHSGSEGSYNLKGNSGFSSNYHTWTENTIFKLDAGDTIRVYYYQSADTSFTINYLSYFSGYLLG